MSQREPFTKRKQRFAILLVVTTAIVTAGSVSAEYVGGPGGTWPKDWPQELDPLRKQAWTWEGGLTHSFVLYQIPFDKREKFESAWPHLLQVKDKGASITLKRGQHFFGNSGKKAGVWILPAVKTVKSGPMSVTRIVLVVDGDIVDLNRIPIPADTPIIDERFHKSGNPSTAIKPSN